MAVQNKVSLPVIKRLPKYYRYLTNLSADGKDKISSSELAHMMGTTASQVRQDFNCFGGFGQQGIGYKVDVLLTEIGKLLFGNGELLPTVLIGAGRLGGEQGFEVVDTDFKTGHDDSLFGEIRPSVRSHRLSRAAPRTPPAPPKRASRIAGRATPGSRWPGRRLGNSS